MPALGEAAEQALRKVFQGSDSRLRVAAIEILGQLRLGPDLLPQALAAEDLALRGTAVGMIQQWQPEGTLAMLRQAIEDSSGEEWIEVREGIAAALAETPDGEALLLEMAAGDEAASVRRRASTLSGKGEVESAAISSAPASTHLGRRFEEDPVVVMETEKGNFEIRCLGREAPIHVANFLYLVEEGFYDGLFGHRVVPNFVVQGGDPRDDGWGGSGQLLRDEIHPNTRYLRGALGMPKAGKDTGSGQIFITHLPTPHLDGNYTIFGQVVSGMEVIDEIEVGDRILRARRKGEDSPR
jgi:cyclophilin family peptidyl-prolyl cis-trans isomerase